VHAGQTRTSDLTAVERSPDLYGDITFAASGLRLRATYVRLG
jgi:hypothetical protein